MKCDELKADKTFVFGEECEAYKKSEADKVIAELKSDIADLRDDKKTTDAVLNERNEEIAELNQQIESLKDKLRHKYKRCLAMAQEWRSLAGFYGMKASCFNHRGFGRTAQKYSRREFHAWKCVKQWLAIAKKFKPNSTAQ